VGWGRGWGGWGGEKRGGSSASLNARDATDRSLGKLIQASPARFWKGERGENALKKRQTKLQREHEEKGGPREREYHQTPP